MSKVERKASVKNESRTKKESSPLVGDKTMVRRKRGKTASDDIDQLQAKIDESKKCQNRPPTTTLEHLENRLQQEFIVSYKMDGITLNNSCTLLDPPLYARLRLALKVAWLVEAASRGFVNPKEIWVFPSQVVVPFLSSAYPGESAQNMGGDTPFRSILASLLTKDPVWIGVGLMQFLGYSLPETRPLQELLTKQEIWEEATKLLEENQYALNSDSDGLARLGTHLAQVPDCKLQAFGVFPTYYGALGYKTAVEGCRCLTMALTDDYPAFILFRVLESSPGIGSTYDIDDRAKLHLEKLSILSDTIPYKDGPVQELIAKRIFDEEGYSKDDNENDEYVHKIIERLNSIKNQPDNFDMFDKLDDGPANPEEINDPLAEFTGQEHYLEDMAADMSYIDDAESFLKKLNTVLPPGLRASQMPHIERAVRCSEDYPALLSNIADIVNTLVTASYHQGKFEQTLELETLRASYPEVGVQTTTLLSTPNTHSSSPAPGSSRPSDAFNPTEEDELQREYDVANVRTLLTDDDLARLLTDINNMVAEFKKAKDLNEAIKNLSFPLSLESTIGSFTITARQAESIRQAEGNGKTVTGLEGMTQWEVIRKNIELQRSKHLDLIKLSKIRYCSEMVSFLSKSPFGLIPWIQLNKVEIAIGTNPERRLSSSQSAILALAIMKWWYGGRSKTSVTVGDNILLNKRVWLR